MAVGEGLWPLESSILQKLAVRKHFPSVGFESVVEGFESLSAIFSFQVMDSNPYVGDSNHFDLDSNHLVQI